MAFTRNFLFTDPVAAQQAVQYAQLANQEQAQADQAFNDRIRTGTQGRISQQNAQQQMLLSQSQLAQRAAEAEKDRELARQGYTSAQTVAGITAGQRDNVLKARTVADAEANKAFALENFNRGSSFAEMLNNANTPLSLKQKLMQSGDVVMGPDGRWRSRHANPSEHITDLLNRRAGMGPSTISVTPAPSPGFTPRVTDFDVPVEYPGGPMVSPDRSQGMMLPFPRSFRNQSIDPVLVPEIPVDQPWMQSGF